MSAVLALVITNGCYAWYVHACMHNYGYDVRRDAVQMHYSVLSLASSQTGVRHVIKKCAEVDSDSMIIISLVLIRFNHNL